MRSAPLAPRWRLLLTPPLGGAENMAVDVALMERARRTGEAVLRIYTWAVPTLSLGRNQTAVGRYALDRIRERGIGVVRRPTGGRAILHHREITYSVTAPAPDEAGIKPSYHRINVLLLDALHRLGVRADVVDERTRALRPTDAPCFVAPSAGEMTTGGRKLVGSAQWRDAGALLQHGSILVDDDQAAIAALMVEPPPPAPAVGTLREALGRAPGAEEVAEAAFAAVRSREDPHAAPLDAAQAIAAGEAALGAFRDDQWTWRR